MGRNLVERIRSLRSTGTTRISRGRRWAKWSAVGVIAFMLLSLAVGLARPRADGAQAVTGIGQVGPMAQPTTAAGRPLSSGELDQTNAPSTIGEDAKRETQASGPVGTANNAPPSQPWDRMIIRTANLQVQVEDVSVSMDRVRLLAVTHGGFVSQAESRLSGEFTYATLTLQVSVAEFDALVSELRKLTDKPIIENVSSSDVTEEYTDLQSQLRNLQATEGRIQTLMAKAEQLDDILALDRELRQIRGEIERAQGRLNFLSSRAEMSTITISLSPVPIVVEPKVEPVKGWDAGEIALRAWYASLDMLSGVATVLITGVVYLWWAVPLVLIASIVLLRPRRRVQSTGPSGDGAPA